tara:strand:+ start:836 stop:2524 length:1689 start_codon:yes stop_codon:yes gene_type:complete
LGLTDLLKELNRQPVWESEVLGLLLSGCLLTPPTKLFVLVFDVANQTLSSWDIHKRHLQHHTNEHLPPSSTSETFSIVQAGSEPVSGIIDLDQLLDVDTGYLWLAPFQHKHYQGLLVANADDPTCAQEDVLAFELAAQGLALHLGTWGSLPQAHHQSNFIASPDALTGEHDALFPAEELTPSQELSRATPFLSPSYTAESTTPDATQRTLTPLQQPLLQTEERASTTPDIPTLTHSPHLPSKTPPFQAAPLSAHRAAQNKLSEVYADKSGSFESFSVDEQVFSDISQKQLELVQSGQFIAVPVGNMPHKKEEENLFGFTFDDDEVLDIQHPVEQLLLHFHDQERPLSSSFLRYLGQLGFETKVSYSLHQVWAEAASLSPSAISFLPPAQEKVRKLLFQFIRHQESTQYLPIIELSRAMEQEGQTIIHLPGYQSPPQDRTFWTKWLKTARQPQEDPVSILLIGEDIPQPEWQYLYHWSCGPDIELRSCEHPSIGVQLLYEHPPDFLSVHIQEDMDSWGFLFNELAQNVRTCAIPLLLISDAPLSPALEAASHSLNTLILQKDP